MAHAGLTKVCNGRTYIGIRLTMIDLDPVPPEQRTWGGIDYWAVRILLYLLHVTHILTL